MTSSEDKPSTLGQASDLASVAWYGCGTPVFKSVRLCGPVTPQPPQGAKTTLLGAAQSGILRRDVADAGFIPHRVRGHGIAGLVVLLEGTSTRGWAGPGKTLP
jgi:hypothetical protein